jgi:predicted Zn-dependent protease
LHGVIDHGLKYIDLPIPELYDLAADPGEQHNLADAGPGEVKDLRSLVAHFPDALPRAAAEDAATSERLRSLGYVSGGFVPRSRYTAADDPKRLIGIDRELQQIVDLYLRGDSTAALDRARELAKRQPSMPIAWLQLAHLERKSGNLPRAVDALRRAHALNPSNTQVTSLLGGYLTQAGRRRRP